MMQMKHTRLVQTGKFLKLFKNDTQYTTPIFRIDQKRKNLQFVIVFKLEDDDFKAQLYRLINRLAPQRKEVCLLKIQQGMSNQEVADAMNISVATVKSHYTQVIKSLRSQIDKIIIVVLIIKYFM